MRRSGWARLGLLAALYLSQGLPYGFFTQALPALLREQGLSLPAIGLTSLLALPWALKFLWAPLVDRRGSRRAWILSMQAGAAGLAVVVGLLDPATALWVVLGCVLVSNLLAATQDIATDGLAVELLPPAERGLGNGVQVAGYRLGMILGGGVLLWQFDALGWAGVFGAMALMLAAASVPVALAALPAPARRPRQEEGGALADMVGWLWVPGHGAWLAALLAYKAGHYLAQGMLRPWLIDAGLELPEIGALLGGAGFTAGLVGALAGGASINLLGRRRALGLLGGVSAVSIGGYALVAAAGVGVGGGAGLWAACLFEHFASGMATAALFTVMMDACRPGRGGGDYTLQASAVVLASGAASGLSGFVAEALGYAGLFALAAGVGVAGAGVAAAVGLGAAGREEAL